jgi:hypothetical protein
LKEGIPTDSRFRDEYLNNVEKEKNSMVQWLESFKSKYAEYEEAADIIGQVETAFELYQSVIGKSKAKIEVQKAIEARGAPLEYDIKWHLERFNRKVYFSLRKVAKHT